MLPSTKDAPGGVLRLTEHEGPGSGGEKTHPACFGPARGLFHDLTAADTKPGRALHKRSFLQRIQQARFLWITVLQKGIA
jgi:hypothetical protein